MASQKNRPTTVFVTGTDTGVGKTRVSAALMRALAGQGRRVVGFKPVASGVDADGQEDVIALQAAASVSVPDRVMNPFCFQEPIAPHIAAEREGRQVKVAALVEAYNQLVEQSEADTVVVEGAGGWLVPLNAEETLADLVQALQIPVLLVVGIRLGCLNHSLLTAENLKARGVPMIGWVANHVDPDTSVPQEQVQTLIDRLPSPLLHRFPYQPGEESVWSGELPI